MFDGQFGVLETRVVGGRHLKMRLRADSGELVEAIAFRHLDGGSVPGIRADDRVEAAYRTTVDDYTGTRRLQLVTEWVAPLASR
jgi:single-stranded-DNA-specific exonuclease